MQVTVRVLTEEERKIGKPTPPEFLPRRQRPDKPHRLTLLDRTWFDFGRIAGHRIA